jgi:hypothetical protein
MSKDNKDVLQFLDSFDDIPDTSVRSKQPKPSVVGDGTPGGAAGAGEAAEALAFLDELTQQSSRPTRVLTPGPRVRNTASPAPGGAARSSAPGAGNVPISNNGLSASQAAASSKNDGAVKADEPSGGGWGWGSVWTSASAALAQAKNVVEEQVKTLPSEPAKKWSEGLATYVKATQLDKLGEDVSFIKYKYTLLTCFDPSLRQRYPRSRSVHPIPNDQRRRTPHRRT